MNIEKMLTAEMPDSMVGKVVTSFDTQVSDPDNNVASYGLTKQLNDNLTASNQTAGVTDVPFRFGCTDDGKFGYIINQGGADSVIPFKNIQPLGIATVNGASDTYSLTSAEVGSIYLMVYISSSGVGSDRDTQVKGLWYNLNKTAYTITGGILLNSFAKFVDSSSALFMKLFFVEATSSTVTLTSSVLYNYDIANSCFAVKLT